MQWPQLRTNPNCVHGRKRCHRKTPGSGPSILEITGILLSATIFFIGDNLFHLPAHDLPVMEVDFDILLGASCELTRSLSISINRADSTSLNFRAKHASLPIRASNSSSFRMQGLPRPYPCSNGCSDYPL